VTVAPAHKLPFPIPPHRSTTLEGSLSPANLELPDDDVAEIEGMD
jgi:hypothetical protein